MGVLQFKVTYIEFLMSRRNVKLSRQLKLELNHSRPRIDFELRCNVPDFDYDSASLATISFGHL